MVRFRAAEAFDLAVQIPHPGADPVGRRAGPDDGAGRAVDPPRPRRSSTTGLPSGAARGRPRRQAVFARAETSSTSVVARARRSWSRAWWIRYRNAKYDAIQARRGPLRVGGLCEDADLRASRPTLAPPARVALKGGHEGGPGGGASGRALSRPITPRPVPDRGGVPVASGPRRAKGLPVRRDEHGADGRGRDAGLALPRAGPPLRPHGGRRAFARRSIRCAEVELFIAVKGYGRI